MSITPQGTTNLSNAPPATRQPTYPPDLADIASQLLRALWSADYPDVPIDIDGARLVCQDRIDRSADVTREYGLISSLIDHFTGALTWRDYENISIHPAIPTEADPSTNALLEHDKVVNLYTQFRNRFAVECKRDMQDYWDSVQANGKSRRREFISARIATLTLEAHMRLEQGEITSQEFTMLQAMLEFGADHAGTQPQRHGVYSLSLVVGEQPAVIVSDAFVLVSQRRVGVPPSDDVSLGSVVCYLPRCGFEAFGSFKQMTQKLTRRLGDPEQRQSMLALWDLKHLDQKTMDLNPSHQTSPLQCRYVPLDRGFLGQQFSRLVAREQGHFDECVWQARSMGLNDQAFDALQTRSLESSRPFDDHESLRRNDVKLVHTQMPEWWQTMDKTRRRHWLRHARTFARKVVNLKTLSEAHFEGAEFTSDGFMQRHIQTTIDHALAELNIQHNPQDMLVTVTKAMPLPVSAALAATIKVAAGTAEFSLADYCYRLLTGTHSKRILRTRLTDRAGVAIAGLDDGFLEKLTARLEDMKAWNDFLDHHLKTSAYAAQLRQIQGDIMRARMHMGLLEIKQQRFPAKGIRWIQAVLDGPDPATRRTVESQHIAVRCLEINHKRLPNVMVLSPTENFEKGPMVLCTLGAPDNIVFRWYDSPFQMNFGFVENKHFRPYLALQLASSRRAQAWGMLEYNASLRHWGMPVAFEYLPTPLSIVRFILHPVTFSVQQDNLYSGCCDIRLEQLIEDIQARLEAGRAARQSGDAFAFTASIAMWFLPPPITIALAVGAGLCKAWEGFQKIDDGDTAGAARELLSALGYLAGAALVELAVHADDPLPAEQQVVGPHLVRRTGRDGQQQIGYLLSPAGAPQWASPSAVAPWNAQRFTAIRIEGEEGAGYVERRLNLFGRSRLYRRAPADENMLIHEDEYVTRTKDNTWKIVSSRPVTLSPMSRRTAVAELTRLLQGWPTSATATTDAESSILEARYMALAEASNTEFFPNVLNYAQGGSRDVNALLRAGASNAKTRILLNEFYQLTDWSGVAFRATHVSNACWPMLQRNLGTVFVDRGLQSGSMSRINALQWSQDMFVTQHSSGENKPVFFIFAPSIPKKNMFCEFLGDHVCVPPDTPLQLQAFNIQDDKLFVYFGAPAHAPWEMFDVYTGHRYIPGPAITS